MKQNNKKEAKRENILIFLIIFNSCLFYILFNISDFKPIFDFVIGNPKANLSIILASAFIVLLIAFIRVAKHIIDFLKKEPLPFPFRD